MKRALGDAALMLLVSILCIAFYDRFVVTRTVKPTRIAIVDVADVFRKKEAEFARLVTRRDTSDKDRDDAIGLAQRFSQDMANALAALPQECECVLLARSSVAGMPPETQDLTPELKRRVGL